MDQDSVKEGVTTGEDVLNQKPNHLDFISDAER